MIGPIRFIVIAAVVLTAIYWLLSVYFRSVARENLEREWQSEVGEGDREAYVREGLKRYEHSLRRRLLVLVYVIPALAFAVLFYVMNFG